MFKTNAGIFWLEIYNNPLVTLDVHFDSINVLIRYELDKYVSK